MGKLNTKISPPGSMTLAQGPMHTDGIQKGSHGRGGALGNPGRSVGTGNPQGRLPIRKPSANLANTTVGQSLPNVSNAASKLPNRKGGSAFYGDK